MRLDISSDKWEYINLSDEEMKDKNYYNTKVYCEDCKYLNGYSDTECHHLTNKEIFDTYYSSNSRYKRLAGDINKNNDCSNCEKRKKSTLVEV